MVQAPVQRCLADRILLHNVSWDRFERLLEDLGESRSARVAYDDGTLEIMTPLPEHEYFKEIWSDSVKDIADELEQDYGCYGSTTWRKKIQKAGIEPDNCFYFQNELLVRGRVDLDLETDPPPDLALEIDLTSKSLPRLPIYRRLGVPEIWCYDNGKLSIRVLQNGEYVLVERSRIFPELDIQALPQVIAKHQSEGHRSVRKSVRAWVREQIASNLT